jgi:hypothetical protein
MEAVVKLLEKAWKNFIVGTTPPATLDLQIVREIFMTGAQETLLLIQKDPKNFSLMWEEIKNQVKVDILDVKTESEKKLIV